VHVRAARLHVSPLSVRLGDSFEGVRAKSFGRVVRVNSFRRVTPLYLFFSFIRGAALPCAGFGHKQTTPLYDLHTDLIPLNRVVF